MLWSFNFNSISLEIVHNYLRQSFISRKCNLKLVRSPKYLQHFRIRLPLKYVAEGSLLNVWRTSSIFTDLCTKHQLRCLHRYYPKLGIYRLTMGSPRLLSHLVFYHHHEKYLRVLILLECELTIITS